MNIFKKIKCWIIKKLGGYTEEEYAYVMDKWGNALKRNEEFYNVMENNLRIAGDNSLYWLNKYDTELDNYLALLNAYNTLAEQKQKMLTPVDMLKGITAYCDSKDNCDVCEFYMPSYGCKIHNIPCYWEVE